MSKTDDYATAVARKVERLRQALEAGEWPVTADKLLEDVHAPGRELEELSAQETAHLLSLAINDALEGVDISQRYPTFYQHLLADPELQQNFIDALEILEQTMEDALEPLPAEPSRDLSFLSRKRRSQPGISERIATAWETICESTIPQLRQSFVASPALLRGTNDSALVLLNEHTQLAEHSVTVLLEANRAPRQVNQLELNLWITADDTESSLPAMEATLCWGTYRETVAVESLGKATFPAIAISQVTDQEGEIAYALQIQLASLEK